MNKQAYEAYIKLLLKHKKTQKKDLLIGIITLCISIIAYLINQAIGNLMVISFLFISSIANFTENEVFWNANDFISLNIKTNTIQYFILFIIQRILLDSYLSSIVVTTGLIIFLFVRFSAIQTLTFILFVVWYYVISPGCSIIFKKKNRIAITICISILILIPIMLVLDYLFAGRLESIYRPKSIVDLFVCLIFLGICYSAISLVSVFYQSEKNNGSPVRTAFLFLKQIDIWLYKDYILVYKALLTNIVSVIVTLSLFVTHDSFGILRPFLLWIICSINFFSAKDKTSRQLLIIYNDPLFCKLNDYRDCAYVRRKKFKTILSGSVIRLTVVLPYLVLLGFYSVINVFVFYISSLISSLIECYTVFRNSITTNAVSFVLKTTIPVVWGCVILKGYSMLICFYYLLTFLILSAILVFSISKINNSSVI